MELSQNPVTAGFEAAHPIAKWPFALIFKTSGKWPIG